MDWRTFFATVIRSLAWPGGVVALAFILRNELRALLNRIAKVSGGGMTVELREAIEDIKTIGEPPGDELPPQIQITHTLSALHERYDAVVNGREAEIVAGSVQRLERSAKEAVKRLKLPLAPYGGEGKALGDAGVFIPTVQRLYHALIATPRRFEQGDKPSPVESLNLSDFAVVLAEYLDKMKDAPPKRDGDGATTR